MAKITRVPVKQLNDSFDVLKSSLELAQSKAGSVKLKDVQTKIGNNKPAKAALKAVKDEFAITRKIAVSAGCSTTTITKEEAPEGLPLSKVKTVLAALIEAKRQLKRINDNDATLSKVEVARAFDLPGLSGKIVQAAVTELIPKARPTPSKTGSGHVRVSSTCPG
ncbi:MAG: hypothetical protein HY903_17620 [Deltaproteobacteria bacterium]|nr:hypothetical protein [Deltaproteobacteria bacterium]